MESWPISIVDGSRNTGALRIHEFIPEGMKLINRVMIFERNQVSTLVTIRVSLIIEIQVVEWLMHITNVMNQEAKGVGLSEIFVTCVQMVEDEIINVTLLVLFAIISGAEPLDQVSAAISHVVLVEVIVVNTIIIFVLEDFILEVEIRLPSSSMIFDIIGKCGAFNEGMIHLTIS